MDILGGELASDHDRVSLGGLPELGREMGEEVLSPWAPHPPEVVGELLEAS